MKGWDPEQLAEVDAAIRLGECCVPPDGSLWVLAGGERRWRVHCSRHFGPSDRCWWVTMEAVDYGIPNKRYVRPHTLGRCLFVPANAEPFAKWERVCTGVCRAGWRL